MKIKALRVADVGIFRDPVSVEGFSGGLDVLAGPNELGKSTLFRALQSVFLTRHSTTGKKIDRMASRGGARAPLIEAEFEVAGQPWRITKRYGRSKSADLVDLSLGRLVARGADAEDRLAELIGVSGSEGAAGRFGLLWVGQQQSLSLPTPDYDPEKRKDVARGERATLHEAIAKEVEAVAGGVLMGRIAQRVAADLDQLVQSKRRGPRTGSRYDAAIRERQALIAKRDHAYAEQAKATTRLDKLESLTRQQAVEASPERLGALRQERDVAAKAHEDAAGRAAALAHAMSREETAGLVHTQASDRLARYGKALEEVRALEVEREGLVVERQRFGAERGSLVEALAVIEAEIAALEKLIQRETEAAERRQEVATLSKSVTEQETALARVGELQAEIKRLEAAISANPATPERMQALANAVQSLALARERAQQPAAVEMVLSLEEVGARLVRIDGEPAPASGRIAVDRQLRIEIEGVGRFDLVPADAVERALRRQAATEAQARLVATEAEIGVRAGADADALAEKRRRWSEALIAARAGLAAVARDGPGTIETALAADRQQLAVLRTALREAGELNFAGEQEAGGDGRGDPGKIRRQLLAARDRRDQVLGQSKASEFAQQRVEDRTAEIEERLAGLEDDLGPSAGRLAERDRLAGLVDAAGAALDAVVQQRSSLARTSPSQEEVTRLGEVKRAADKALSQAESAAQRLAQDIAALEGEIRAAGEAEIGPQLARLEAEIVARDAEVSHYEHEVAALELLQDTLAAVASENRMRFLEPVTARLVPYLSQVFGAAQVGLSEGFAIEALRRNMEEEPVEDLSDGTREQLAVLVRLGFGRLLSETGTPAPVILDDALVFADDERIVRMFAALETAAKLHQVIVFTCRSAAFAPLGGTRLSIGPWTGAPL
ncbi:MAG: hypothetical protein H6876_02720 [Hyphomicrobiaceae bacterium]|nr:hypothetical protein [Hyphomicrobiaceae bacterium]MCC0007019.1 hypothetical protein [Hyphomicrobiaceae bacterium]